MQNMIKRLAGIHTGPYQCGLNIRKFRGECKIQPVFRIQLAGHFFQAFSNLSMMSFIKGAGDLFTGIQPDS